MNVTLSLFTNLFVEALFLAVVGTLGGVWANLLFHTHYPIWYGWFGALTIRVVMAWLAKILVP